MAKQITSKRELADCPNGGRCGNPKHFVGNKCPLNVGGKLKTTWAKPGARAQLKSSLNEEFIGRKAIMCLNKIESTDELDEFLENLPCALQDAVNELNGPMLEDETVKRLLQVDGMKDMVDHVSDAISAGNLKDTADLDHLEDAVAQRLREEGILLTIAFSSILVEAAR